ncbi:LOW QUALITY PROTEIN: Hypothetical protein PHPALM_9450 [Phytophthora palmivora]|uniref:Ubiquitin-like protease family profile domain-containing protein n=1 Tax=Phytophthora palmivora TaxID=4796 RepID=A0A2P4Y7A2_9STRA|nr:LOW QUALITY PROTEIN: Hypothetical protein PHPALM_9450 [Phytophthora palmivora]
MDAIDLSEQADPHFKVTVDPELKSNLQSMSLRSEKLEALDQVHKQHLSDTTKRLVMTARFGMIRDVVTLDATALGIAADTKMAIDYAAVDNLFVGMSTERVLLPINCNGNHWCAVMIDLPRRSVYVYDPMKSSYAVSPSLKILPLAYQTPELLANMSKGLCHVLTDRYNCGMYVLLTFEEFVWEKCIEVVDMHTLQFLRFR